MRGRAHHNDAPTDRCTGRVSLTWLAYGLILILAGALRAYHLDGQLWFDEISALRGYRKPFIEILTTFPPFFPNPLYELMAHLGILTLGESALSIRLPSAIFGVAGVLMFYRLARRCLEPADALLAGALLAVSFHHISYSQDARGYTTYLFFGLLATDRLLALFRSMRWRTALGYVTSVALATYSHAFGVFILAGQMMVALPIAWLRRRAGSLNTPTPAQITGTAVLGGLLTMLLYAPLIRQSVEYALTEATSEGHGPRVLDLLPELLEGLLAGFGGWPGLVLASFLGVVGTVDLLRRHPLVLLLLSAPVAVSAVSIAALGAGIHPRYFLFALPVGYLVGTRGFMLVVRWLLQRCLRMSDLRAIRIQWILGALAVVVACVPLIRYYSMPKQDYLGAIRVVRTIAGPQDRVVAADMAGIAIAAYYQPDICVVANIDELLSVEASGGRVWVISTLERGMHTRAPAMLARLKDSYRLARWLPGSMGDGGMRIYAGPVESGQNEAEWENLRNVPDDSVSTQGCRVSDLRSAARLKLPLRLSNASPNLTTMSEF